MMAAMAFPPHLHDSLAVNDAGEVLRKWARSMDTR